MINEAAFIQAIEQLIPDGDDVADIAIIVTYQNGDTASAVSKPMTHGDNLRHELIDLAQDIGGVQH